ncbi:MAG: Flp pilus assembly complex ATPase component TadA [Candidatus Marsarchaeota archaeon]|nr:Flp pilus assembly complex ATPase component TadA [Candidatus Marsarchaeota archaeon]MCL5419151.1 Flp pilus assembly complex ATPase component TadA [Candidatus Marsarchaeota archaeon]
MLGIMRRIVPKQQKGEGNVTASLSFIIEKEFPDTVLGKNEHNNTTIGKSGSRMLYALFCPELSGEDEVAMAHSKATVINALLGGGASVRASDRMALAIQIAKGALMGMNTSAPKDLLAYLVANDVVGYGPISILLDDGSNIEEIVINSPTGNIGIYHTRYGYCDTNMRFASESDFLFVINKLISFTEREINNSNPVIDAEISRGSRIHAQLKPYALSGAAASIRIGGRKSLDAKRLMALKTATPEVFAYLWLAIDARCNIVVSGAPSSGKTTMLAALNAFVPKHERIITIEEDMNEISYFGNFMNVVQLQGSQKGPVTTRDQIVNALHLRPDRIVIGEIRGSEAAEVLAGSNFGVPFMTTMHSSGNGAYIISRLRSKPMAIDDSLLSMLDISIFMRQNSSNTRVIDSIDEYRWLSRNEISAEKGELYDIVELAHGGSLVNNALGGSKVIERYAGLHMLKASSAVKELKSRATFLEAMLHSDSDAYAYIEKYGVA